MDPRSKISVTTQLFFESLYLPNQNNVMRCPSGRPCNVQVIVPVVGQIMKELPERLTEI
jgi:hypothetical protein